MQASLIIIDSVKIKYTAAVIRSLRSIDNIMTSFTFFFTRPTIIYSIPVLPTHTTSFSTLHKVQHAGADPERPGRTARAHLIRVCALID